MSEERIQTPGDVRIKKLTIASKEGKFLNILDYLIELNIYESIFTPAMTGSITLGDSRNLINSFPIVGEEILSVEFTTPGTGVSVEKIFRIHSIVEKNYVGDGSSQVYSLEFSSVELIRDISNAIYRSFEGTPSSIVNQIFEEYLKVSRTIPGLSNNTQFADSNYTPLTIFTSTKNLVKFVSPGWTPIKCINWLCAHSEPAGSKASDFLFWETNKRFYFGAIEDIIANKDNIRAGTYYYSAPLINSNTDVGNKMMGIRDISFKRVFDQFANKTDGFLSSRVVDVDLINKTYENYEYDYTNEYNNYKHLEGEGSYPLHSFSTSRNPKVHTIVNYNIPGLYSGISSNFSERYKFVYGNRRSNIMKLNNLRMKLVVPGRSDLEAGTVIEILLPRGFPNSPEERNELKVDDMYSGKYLITSINHKINPISHFITMEVTKDSIIKART